MKDEASELLFLNWSCILSQGRGTLAGDAIKWLCKGTDAAFAPSLAQDGEIFEETGCSLCPC
jgi:hypothetical protein